MFLQDRFARLYIGYSTRENFFSFPRASVLISSSLPASAHRTKERRTFPTNRGRGEPSASRRRWKKEFPSRRENEENLRGEPENDEGDERGSRKNKKEQGRTNQQRTSPLFAITERCVLYGTQCKNRGHWIAVRSALQMRFVRYCRTDRIRCGFAIEK